MTTFITRSQSYRKLLEEKLQYGYIHQHIQQPRIDEEKWKLLQLLVAQHRSLTPMQRERYIITTMLVQIALDTHDLVPVKRIAETEQETLTKQLQVLTGDYYSGLYYFLLAEVGEVDYIQTLASAIRKINELKMKLYYKESLTFHEWIEIYKKINSMLIVHVAQFLYDDSANDLITDWLIIQRLENEKINHDYASLTEQFTDGNPFTSANSMVKNSFIDTYREKLLDYAQSLSKQCLFIIQYIQGQQNNNVKTSTRI